MLFLINNPAIAFILFIVLGFTILMGIKIFEELTINKALSLKQRQMRISSPIKGFKSRIAMLTSAALAPVVAVVVVVSVALAPQTVPGSVQLIDLKSSDDIFEIYTTFQERMETNFDTFGLRIFDSNLGSPEMALDGEIDYLSADNGTASDDFSGNLTQIDHNSSKLGQPQRSWTRKFTSSELSNRTIPTSSLSSLSTGKIFRLDFETVFINSPSESSVCTVEKSFSITLSNFIKVNTTSSL